MTSDLSASSSVTSLLRAAALLLEVDDEDEKFFWDLVTEPFSKVPSSFPVALRMLLNGRK